MTNCVFFDIETTGQIILRSVNVTVHKGHSEKNGFFLWERPLLNINKKKQ